jgi:aminoglycoside phosphotransferase (APT) family kinase protein
LLSRLQSKRISGFGILKPDGQWEFESFQDFVNATLEKRKADIPYLVQAGLASSEATKMFDVVKELESSFYQQPVLCHGDLSMDHLFVDSDLNITAIIDWGLCQAGSPALDIAVLLMYHPEIKLGWLLSKQTLELSETAFLREMLIQQANVAMSFVGHDMRESNEDAREIAVQGMRSMLETGQSL